MKLTETARREKEFHEKLYLDNKGNRGLVTKSYIAYEFVKRRTKRKIGVINSKVLEIGCGMSLINANYYSSNNCEYTGVDVSENCIEENKKLAKKLNLKAEFIADDGNTLFSLKGRKFDLIFMSAVLHHLELNIAIPNLKKLLNKKGKLIMIEPMGENPLINIFRKFTPNIRTADEHPLLFKDLNYILKILPKTTFEFHSITSLFLAPFAYLPSKRFVKFLYKTINFWGYLDMILSKMPILKRLSWVVLIEAQF